jgi:[CysO sulfur-carrier protein]-S-L-cysteine hydrolase
MQAISLTAEQIKELVSIAKDALPDEACAFLLGKNDTVVKILPTRNLDKSPVTFSIDPGEVLYAYNIAESKGLQVVAIFHSHPAKPSPSSTDIKFMEINPVVWLIYSTTEWRLKAYVYDDDVKEVTIKIAAMG